MKSASSNAVTCGAVIDKRADGRIAKTNSRFLCEADIEHHFNQGPLFTYSGPYS
ncbi:hypothetical protein OE749_16605 [Aestuariibacter sp. AA17]|uniref:Uncharacterized protein n=1 Tax=Fluctibacter corallii TaxID=2984329 RepID=A0ABT3ACB8_9ALTE|nr:hypothetical protein [Aestuariibacter sp. AA17]MCV2886317.1 hypothetical protein [Aestuariibacter sp. AA17]